MHLLSGMRPHTEHVSILEITSTSDIIWTSSASCLLLCWGELIMSYNYSLGRLSVAHAQ